MGFACSCHLHAKSTSAEAPFLFIDCNVMFHLSWNWYSHPVEQLKSMPIYRDISSHLLQYCSIKHSKTIKPPYFAPHIIMCSEIPSHEKPAVEWNFIFLGYFTCTSFTLVHFYKDIWFSCYCLNHILLFFSLTLSAL